MNKDFWMGAALGGFAVMITLLAIGLYAEAYLPK